jgi:hypothetical protein
VRRDALAAMVGVASEDDDDRSWPVALGQNSNAGSGQACAAAPDPQGRSDDMAGPVLGFALRCFGHFKA